MSKIIIKGSKDEYDGMFIKSIDKVNEKVEFTKDSSEAYYRESGFYVNAEIDFLKFYFSKQYPCMAYAKAW
jgi:hypothetical protein